VKKVFDKRNLKLFERLLENQGVSLKKDNTLNEVSLSKRLSSFKQAVVGSTGEDAWKDAWDIASSGMSDPEAEKQLYQAAAEWWHSTGKLKKEETSVEDENSEELNLLRQISNKLDTLEDLDTSIDYLASVLSGEDTLSVAMRQKFFGRAAQSDPVKLKKEIRGLIEEPAEEPVSSKEKADQLLRTVSDLGLTDLQNNTKNLLGKLADLLKDKPAEETEKAIDNLKKVAQDGELDQADVAAVAKEVPAADAEPSAQEPELKLSLRNDGVNIKGILKYLSEHPRVSDEQVEAMAKYFQKIIPGNLIMFERDTNAAPTVPATKKPKKKKKVANTPYIKIVNNPELKRTVKQLRGPREVGDVLNGILRMATQLKKPDKQAALKVAVGLQSGGLGKKKQAKQAPVPLTTDTGPIKNLVDTMSSLEIPDDIIEKVFDALDDQLQGKAPVHESINKKRKVVIRYGKSKAKKEES